MNAIYKFMKDHGKNPGILLGMFMFVSRLFGQSVETPPAAKPGGWASLGAMSAPEWDGKTLTCHSEQGSLAVTPLSDDVVRVPCVLRPRRSSGVTIPTPCPIATSARSP
jgi:hypothetical protein